MARYDRVVREAALRRILPPNAEPIAKVAREMQISLPTLISWKKHGLPLEEAAPEKERFSSEEKFYIVAATAFMDATERAEYAKVKGIDIEEIDEWRYACQKANGDQVKEHIRLQNIIKEQQRKIQEIQNEISIKERKLAEIAALELLEKKAAALFGKKK